MIDKESEEGYDLYTIVIKSNCEYCRDAVQLLEENQKHYKCIDLSSLKDKNCLIDIQKHYNHYTVPLIFNNNKGFIGGYINLVKHLKQDK